MTLLWLSSECGRGENAPILPSFVELYRGFTPHVWIVYINGNLG